MMEFLLQAVFAFLLFSVLLPLFGVLLGLFCYYVLPYLFGGLAMLGLALILGVKFILTWWVWLVALAWASAVHLIRRKLRSLGHEIEHYHAANMVLLGGVPFHRKLKQQPQPCPD